MKSTIFFSKSTTTTIFFANSIDEHNDKMIFRTVLYELSIVVTYFVSIWIFNATLKMLRKKGMEYVYACKRERARANKSVRKGKRKHDFNISMSTSVRL